MMGGVEVRFEIRAGRSALEFCVRATMNLWPQAAFEDGSTGAYFSRFRDIPFGILDELFVYRDAQIARRWEHEGAVPGLEDSMVHWIIGDDVVIAVVDNPDSEEMRQLLEAVKSGLSSEIFCITAERRAA